MLLFFSASFPCALKINGKYCAQIENTTYSYQTDSVCLIESFALINGGETRAFLTEERFLKNPPEFIVVTDIIGGYFIEFIPPKPIKPFNILAQEKNDYLIETAFYDNGAKLSIETPYSFYAEDLPINTESALIECVNLGGELLVAVKVKSESTWLLVFAIDNDIKKVFSANISEYSFNNGLTTKTYLKDFAKHTVTKTGEYKNKSFSLASIDIQKKKGFNYNNLPNSLKAYAFFEELLVGGNILEFLTDNMQKKADKLKGYLGDYFGVIPPPRFHNQNAVGLVYNKTSSFYTVRYFCPTFIGDKIDNLTEVK